jgi:hypothetical protein
MYIFSRELGLFDRLFAWLKASFCVRHDRPNAQAWPYAFPATLFLQRERVVADPRPACNDNRDTAALMGPMRGLAAMLATVGRQNVPKRLLGKRAGRFAPIGKAIPKRMPQKLKSYRRLHRPPELAGEMRVLLESKPRAKLLEMKRDAIQRGRETAMRIQRAA